MDKRFAILLSILDNTFYVKIINKREACLYFSIIYNNNKYSKSL